MRAAVSSGIAFLLSCGFAAADITPETCVAAAKYSTARRGHALLVIKDGRTIHESYANGASRGEPHKIYSGTKIFWGLAALAAAEDGILHLDEPVGRTIPEWENDASRRRITVRQLLDFSAGIDPTFRLHGEGFANRNAIALKRPIVAAPGSRFIYGPASLQVFHEVLRRKLQPRGQTPTRYLERRVLRPIGLGSQRYLADDAGNPLLATGFMLSAHDWAKMGRVLLRHGEPIVNDERFEQALRGPSANPAYALGIWNNRQAGRPGAREFDIEDMLDLPWQRQNWSRTCICRDAPRDLVACIGSGYQRLFVIPSMELIVVRQGVNARFSDGEFLRILLGKRGR